MSYSELTSVTNDHEYLQMIAQDLPKSYNRGTGRKKAYTARDMRTLAEEIVEKYHYRLDMLETLLENPFSGEISHQN